MTAAALIVTHSVASAGVTDASWGTGLNGSFEATDAGWLAQNAPTMVVREKSLFSGQTRPGANCRTSPMLSVGEQSDAVNRPRLNFPSRRKMISCRMLQFGGLS